MQMSWDGGPPISSVSFEAGSAERVRRTSPLGSPTAVRTENWVWGEGESCFSQGKGEMEVKEQTGHLSKSGSFLSEKKKNLTRMTAYRNFKDLTKHKIVTNKAWGEGRI